MNYAKGWIGVDLDGTLANYTSWDEQGNKIGKPIQLMVDRVKAWLGAGLDVRIFTARKNQDIEIIVWLREAGLPDLKITNSKDQYMIALFDDRCVQVRQNTGELLGNIEEIPLWGSDVK